MNHFVGNGGTFIKPNINVTYSVDSTGAFMDNLRNFQFCQSDNLVSFDVSSLFTNVPLDETIGLIADCVYGPSSKKVPPFPKKWFTKLLQFATSGMFLYNNKLYKQVDGVAMGSPLGPSLANFFLGHLEDKFFFNSLMSVSGVTSTLSCTLGMWMMCSQCLITKLHLTIF